MILRWAYCLLRLVLERLMVVALIVRRVRLGRRFLRLLVYLMELLRVLMIRRSSMSRYMGWAITRLLLWLRIGFLGLRLVRDLL